MSMWKKFVYGMKDIGETTKFFQWPVMLVAAWIVSLGMMMVSTPAVVLLGRVLSVMVFLELYHQLVLPNNAMDYSYKAVRTFWWDVGIPEFIVIVVCSLELVQILTFGAEFYPLPLAPVLVGLLGVKLLIINMLSYMVVTNSIQFLVLPPSLQETGKRNMRKYKFDTIWLINLMKNAWWSDGTSRLMELLVRSGWMEVETPNSEILTCDIITPSSSADESSKEREGDDPDNSAMLLDPT